MKLLNKIIVTVALLLSSVSCSQPAKPGNMKWIKYNFEQLHTLTDNSSVFNPMSAYRFSTFNMINDTTVVLIGNVSLSDLDLNLSGRKAVIVISKDRGKTFQEIRFPEEEVTDVLPAESNTLVITESYRTEKKNVIYILNNQTLNSQKIAEYLDSNKIYSQFNGEYILTYAKGITKVYNPLTKEEYPLPIESYKSNIRFNNNESVIYFANNELKKFNFISQQEETIKVFKNKYDLIYFSRGNIQLGSVNLLRTAVSYYDLDENELYTETEKTGNYYRYNNFVCDVAQTVPYLILRYSYDYGNTWYEYQTEKFFTSSSQIGFYQDKYIVLKAGYRKGRNKDGDVGARLVIGEFQK